MLYIFLSPTIRRQLFVIPFLRFLRFSMKKAGYSNAIEEPLNGGEKRERNTRLPRQSGTASEGRVKLIQASDYTSDTEWKTVDSGVVG